MAKREHLEGSNKKIQKRAEKNYNNTEFTNFEKGSSKKSQAKDLGQSYEEVFNRIAKEYKGYVDPKDMAYDDRDPEFMEKIQRNAQIKEEIIRKVNAELKIGTYVKPTEQDDSIVPENQESGTIVDMVKETPKIEEVTPQGLGKGDGDPGPIEKPKNISELSTTELHKLGYDFTSPEYGEALKREMREKENDLKKRGLLEMTREDKLKQLGEEIKKGVDVVVIHGNDTSYIEITTGKKKWGISFQNDLDTSGALLMLDKAGIRYTSAEVVKKGGKSKSKNEGRYLHVDTGGEALGIKEGVKGRTIDMYGDHHQKEKGESTSATEIIYNALVETGQLKPSRDLENLVEFITSYDNLSYVDDKKFTKEYFKKDWANSMYAIAKYVSFNDIKSWILDGKRNKDGYFTKSDHEQEITLKNAYEDEKGIKKTKDTLGNIISRLRTQVKYGVIGVETAIKKMHNAGMPTETEELGKIVFNTQDEEENPINPDKKKNVIPNAFIATKAMGYDTFVAFDSEEGRFFINTTTKDLMPLFKRIEARIPGTVLVRGVMILPPKNLADHKITKEEFLEIIGIAPIEENKISKDKVLAELAKGKMSVEDALALGFTVADLTGEVTETNEDKLANLEKELEEVRKERDTLLTNYNARAQAREKEIERLEEKLRSIEQEENKNEEGLKSVDEAERELKYQDPQILNVIKTDNIQRVFNLVLFTLQHKDSVLSEEQEDFLGKNKSLVQKIIEIQTIKENNEAKLIKENTGKSPAGKPIIENPEKFKKDLQKIRESYYQELSNLKE